MEPLKISDVSIADLVEVLAYKVAEPAYDELDLLLIPAEVIGQGIVLRTNGEVWCLSKATFSNGVEHGALTMCMADSGEGPLLWSVWNGDMFVALFVPPSPDFMLESDGPENFSREFGERLEDVFPITIVVIPRFEADPTKRQIVIYAGGKII
jgi:hypothetical protein